MTRFAFSAPISSFMADRPDFSQISNIGNEMRSKNRQVNHEAEGFVASTGLDAMSKVKSAEHNARAIEAGGQARAAQAQAQGISGMMSGIASGIGSMSFGGGGSAASGTSPPFGSMPGTPVSNDYMNRITSFYGA